ncbi:TOBE domain-containing protein [Natronococcus sp. A-GB1]|uniref:TOBE domain-containing protein n=1 Tax=Natronococcus sp. A-GB1 TaxID=3037648 RepID=UPI00242024DB|nr:TOBE domain-containing protein [Natronococcus sp. A-GB1]MDG5758242.1 TOBE domain-containing protein [Natronococcus sp. A-GB1]
MGLPATVVAREPPTVTLGGQEITLRSSARSPPAGASVTCHVRPEDLLLTPSADAGTGETTPSISGEVATVTDVGRRYDVTVRTETGGELVAEVTDDPPTAGERVAIELTRDRIAVFNADKNERDRLVAANETGGESHSNALRWRPVSIRPVGATGSGHFLSDRVREETTETGPKR